MNENETKRDWSVIRERIEAASAAGERLWASDAEEVRRLLKARAEALAKEPEAPVPDDTMTVLEFRLAHESYAIDSAYVTDVQPLTHLTPLPGTPAFLLGIVNLRGEVLPIVDLRTFFDLPISLTDVSYVVVLHCDDMRFGILADAIAGMRYVSVSGFQPAPMTHTGIRERYLLGIAADRLAVLDARTLILDDRLVIRENNEF
jgi:purine-binding chemotaxis protein CheW